MADTDVGPQAYVVGRSLGLQFHPEVTPEIVDDWVRGYRAAEGDGDGIDLDAMLEETNRRAPAARLATMKLFDRFLERVARVSAASSSIDGESHT
jgi:hypothetical protein